MPMGDVKNLRDGVDAIEAIVRVGEFGGDPERPYIGQRHTWTGERGRVHVPRMTLRDLGDKLASSLAWLADDEHGQHLDITALVQSALLEVEPDGTMERLGLSLAYADLVADMPPEEIV